MRDAEAALAVTARLPRGGEVRAFEVLPRDGIVPGSERLIRGYYGTFGVAARAGARLELTLRLKTRPGPG